MVLATCTHFHSNLRSLFKVRTMDFGDTSAKYLDEFCYRFNGRHRRAEMFDRLLRACLEQEEDPVLR